MARPTKAPTAVVWRGFAFVPAGAVRDSPRHAIARCDFAESGDCTIHEVWPIPVVLANLASTAAQFKADLLDHYDDSRATMQELKDWVNLTRSIARRFPYGGPYSEEMRKVADRVDGISQLLSRYLRKLPRSRAEETECRYHFTLWGMNEIRKAARFSRRGFWEGGIGQFLPDVDPRLFDEDNIEKCIQRFSKKLQPVPGVTFEMMGELLRDNTRYGVLLPDGTRNPNGPIPRETPKTN